MRVLRTLLLSGLVAIAGVGSPPHARTARVMGYLNVDTLRVSFVLSVEARSDTTPHQAVPTVTLRCQAGCSDGDYYSEDAPGSLLGVFMASDAIDRAYTTWTKEGVFVIAVYGVLNGRMQKLFQGSSRKVPVWTYKGPAGDAIILSESVRSGGTQRVMDHRYDWSQSASTYVFATRSPQPGPPSKPGVVLPQTQ